MVYMENLIKEKYLLNELRIEKNKDSTDGNVYMIFSDKGKFILKIYNSLKHTKSMIQLHTHLCGDGFSVPKIIFNNEK